MHISEFDYELPEDLIAQEPLPQRDASRLLVADRGRKSLMDTDFAFLPEYLRENDVLVVNNTRVFPARLVGLRDPSGGRVEVLLVRQLGPFVWESLVRPGGRLRQGAKLKFSDPRLRAELLDIPGDELRQLRFDCQGPWETILNEVGETPLPPYIRRPAEAADRERYQTLFASEKGAIAAPTAGLHFTPEVVKRVQTRGARIAQITLHVGYGTFEPIRVEHIEQHRVSSEQFEITEETANLINKARSRGGRVIAVGTTTTRALESAADWTGRIAPVKKSATLTILPGYTFHVTDALLTNFHLPRSSLLLLVSAFAGRDFVLQAYQHAVRLRYRFYSYGDCMLLI